MGAFCAPPNSGRQAKDHPSVGVCKEARGEQSPNFKAHLAVGGGQPTEEPQQRGLEDAARNWGFESSS